MIFYIKNVKLKKFFICYFFFIKFYSCYVEYFDFYYFIDDVGYRGYFGGLVYRFYLEG